MRRKRIFLYKFCEIVSGNKGQVTNKTPVQDPPSFN